jgi:hypothetical protein
MSQTSSRSVPRRLRRTDRWAGAYREFCGRQYTESWLPGDPWRGCEHFTRMCGALGFLRESSPAHAYALLDVLDEDGEILATYDIPHAGAFRFIYRKLHLRNTKPPTLKSGRNT